MFYSTPSPLFNTGLSSYSYTCIHHYLFVRRVVTTIFLVHFPRTALLDLTDLLLGRKKIKTLKKGGGCWAGPPPPKKKEKFDM